MQSDLDREILIYEIIPYDHPPPPTQPHATVPFLVVFLRSVGVNHLPRRTADLLWSGNETASPVMDGAALPEFKLPNDLF